MRQALLDCCYLDWSKISPAIFGSMFQSVMNPKERRNLGAHYTSETNILKLIKPLFLDDLWKEFESIKDSKPKLNDFHKKLSTLKFLDPACGCGNFLVITYRELRLLEIEILRALNKTGQAVLDVSDIIWLDVDMMYGIEFEEFPARIAEVAMWLIDHQMNMQISNEFGQYFVRLPLKKSATIVHGNALRMDWAEVVGGNLSGSEGASSPHSKEDTLPTGRVSALGVSYILGNPPFVGKKEQKPEQKADMNLVFSSLSNSNVLDYVTAWYAKASQYIQNTRIKVAFVSTNSITQGEQIGVLWSYLFNNFDIKIHFAHRTFAWRNEARGNAAVFCVIIGFASFDVTNKRIFEYEIVSSEPHELSAKNVNLYLIDASDLVILSRTSPICDVEEIVFGNMPNDGGHLLLNEEERIDLLAREPNAEKFIRKFYGSEEYINNKLRYCLWLKDASPSELRNLPLVLERVELVRKHRSASTRDATRRLANYPTLFGDYILIPSVSSERRKFIPMGFLPKEVIASNLCLMIPNATIYHFGVLTSTMHMAWTRQVCGRLEGRYRYSNKIVYNNFPWPENPTEKQIKAIETAAQRVLDARLEFPNSSLADLYDPLTMPPVLVKAHNELDKCVDLAYRPQAFTSEANRMVFLFELYEKYTANLFTKAKPKRTKKKKDE
jgi:hypothetical protein